MSRCGFLVDMFIKGVKEFIEFAFSQLRIGDKIKCPYSKCDNRIFLEGDVVKFQLYKNEFRSSCTQWISHGEPLVNHTLAIGESLISKVTINYTHQNMRTCPKLISFKFL